MILFLERKSIKKNFGSPWKSLRIGVFRPVTDLCFYQELVWGIILKKDDGAIGQSVYAGA